MSAQRYVARATNVAARMIDGEMMIMSGADSSLYSLNETASILWQAADGVTPLAQIVERHICAGYAVDPATALRDAEELSEDLARRGILRISDAPLPDPGPPARGIAVSSLMREMGAKALKLGIPLSVQLDLTYRCNERCVHCYLDHDDHGEMTTAEIKDLLDQLAAAGVFFLILSGGEIFLRKDLFEIVEYARKLLFAVKLKTNAVMIRDAKAKRIAALGVESVQISVYSHRARGPRRDHQGAAGPSGAPSRARTLLKSNGVRVSFANVLMKHNAGDYPQVQALAAGLGVGYNVDPTITPMMDGDRSILDLNITPGELEQVFHESTLVGNAEEFCAPPAGPLAEADALDTLPCSAGHTACYISPYGDVFPCVQFPLPSGNVRKTRFLDIWQDSPQLKEVRAITMADLQGCSSCAHGSSCSRCPGLAHMEGNMRGPSIQDCEKSFARTGVPSKHLLRKQAAEIRPEPATRALSPAPLSGSHPVIWMSAQR